MIIREFVKNALLEDLGRGDLFQKICDDLKTSAIVIAKENGILSGLQYTRELCKLAMIESYESNFNDGDCFNKGDILLTCSGSFISILQIERTLLNLLQHSSGIASNTNKYVRILHENNLKTMILDTRKTHPHLRIFEKYSVLNGGGINHRLGLDDCLMLKDTHLAHISNLKDFIYKARQKIPFTAKIEVECESVESAKEAINSGCDIVMCDNMNITDMKEVVSYRNANNNGILIEASGNVNLKNLLQIAKSGVDAISSGAIVHHSNWIDLSMKISKLR